MSPVALNMGLNGSEAAKRAQSKLAGMSRWGGGAAEDEESARKGALAGTQVHSLTRRVHAGLGNTVTLARATSAVVRKQDTQRPCVLNLQAPFQTPQ